MTRQEIWISCRGRVSPDQSQNWLNRNWHVYCDKCICWVQGRDCPEATGRLLRWVWLWSKGEEPRSVRYKAHTCLPFEMYDHTFANYLSRAGGEEGSFLRSQVNFAFLLGPKHMGRITFQLEVVAHGNGWNLGRGKAFQNVRRASAKRVG